MESLRENREWRELKKVVLEIMAQNLMVVKRSKSRHDSRLFPGNNTSPKT